MPTSDLTCRPKVQRRSWPSPSFRRCSSPSYALCTARWPPLCAPLPSVASGDVKAVEHHDLVPCRNEVVHELLVCIVAGVHLGDSSQLGVRAEYEINRGCCPPKRTTGAVAPFVDALFRGRDLPYGRHVEQVDKEVVGQRFGS